MLFLGLKYLNSLMRIRDPGWRQFGSGIREGKKSDPGSGINIPDPPHCFQLFFKFWSSQSWIRIHVDQKWCIYIYPHSNQCGSTTLLRRPSCKLIFTLISGRGHSSLRHPQEGNVLKYTNWSTTRDSKTSVWDNNACKIKFVHQILTKDLILSLKIMCLQVSYKKTIWKTNFFLYP